MNLLINYSIFRSFPELESERLFFRRYTKDDSKPIFRLRSEPHVLKYIDMYPIQHLHQAEEFIEKNLDYFNKKEAISWAIIEKKTGLFAGNFAFWRLQPEHCRCEIGYALLPEFWGKGYISETLKVMLDFGFNKFSLHSIEAQVNPVNHKSVRVLERAGFKREAYFKENYLFDGKYIDTAIYSLLETDYYEMTGKG